MHFSRQAHCQNGEKWSFFGSLFEKARLGFHFVFHFVKNKHFYIHFFLFWVSFRSKMQWKWNKKWSQKWMKNGWKRPTVNNPIVTVCNCLFIYSVWYWLRVAIAEPLTPEELELKELTEEGFLDLSRWDFQQFIRGLEAHGWYVLCDFS